MRLTFTLDDVIRAKSMQFGKMYQKYIDPNIDLSSLDFSSGNLQEIFGFKNKKSFEKFLYEDYPFEVFAEATTCEKQLDKKLNLWLLNLENDEVADELDIKVALSNTNEFNASIGYSYFFVSKIATRIREVFFPSDYLEIWKKTDILVTADPKLLNTPKLQRGISVKIETEYNKDCECDLSYNSLMELLEDEEFFVKIKEIMIKEKMI